MKVSVLLPTLDAEPDLARLLPALERQHVSGDWELVAIDSDSGDCTRQILRRFGARVSWIPRSEFGHAATRNRLAAQARGEILLFLSQDAVPQGERFVESMLAAFDDARVAGATARVLPHDDDDPLTARTVLEAPEAADEPEVLTAGGGGGAPRFNNVASAIRATVLRGLPFPDVPFGEDVAWADRALEAGWSLAFVPEAVVRHAHRYTPAQAFERYRIDAAFHRRLHGRRVRPRVRDVLRGIAHEVRADVRFVVRGRRGWSHLWRSPALRSAQVLGQWFGSRGWRGFAGSDFV